jgi:hypothetical protein
MTDDASSQPEPEPNSQISRLFDIRLIIGGLLSIYGVILLIKGLFDTHAEIAKGAGLHLNLWTGIALLVFGLLMLLWMRLAPLRPTEPKAGAGADPSQ